MVVSQEFILAVSMLRETVEACDRVAAEEAMADVARLWPAVWRTLSPISSSENSKPSVGLARSPRAVRAERMRGYY